MTKMKKALHIAKKTAWFVFLGIFGLIAVVALWLTIDKMILKSPVPSMFGYATLTVETGSMAGQGEGAINPGDMILIKRQKEYKTTDVITYLHEGDTIPTTHRIILTNPDGTFVTKGDANNTKDPELVTKDIIVGKVVHNFKGVGVFSKWLRTEGWIYIMASLAILGLGLFVLASNSEESQAQEAKVPDETKPDEPALVASEDTTSAEPPQE